MTCRQRCSCRGCVSRQRRSRAGTTSEPFLTASPSRQAKACARRRRGPQRCVHTALTREARRAALCNEIAGPYLTHSSARPPARRLATALCLAGPVAMMPACVLRGAIEGAIIGHDFALHTIYASLPRLQRRRAEGAQAQLRRTVPAARSGNIAAAFASVSPRAVLRDPAAAAAAAAAHSKLEPRPWDPLVGSQRGHRHQSDAESSTSETARFQNHFAARQPVRQPLAFDAVPVQASHRSQSSHAPSGLGFAPGADQCHAATHMQHGYGGLSGFAFQEPGFATYRVRDGFQLQLQQLVC